MTGFPAISSTRICKTGAENCVETNKITDMDRRYFIQSMGLVAAAVAVDIDALFGTHVRPRIAITLDDPNSFTSPLLPPIERDQRIRLALQNAGIKAALFVCGVKVDNPAGKTLLRAWNAEGHLIANHSYSHWYLPSRIIKVEDYIGDIARGENIISAQDNFTKLFRFPYLKEGDTAEKRDAVREYLRAQGYRNGYVTIDASDWYLDERMQSALRKNPKIDLLPYRQAYCEHIWDRTSYYQKLCIDVLGHDIPHTLLIHHSLLNALFLGDLIAMFAKKGWGVIDASEAYADPIFLSEPDIMPAGESLVWALAKESGRFEDRLRYPAEDWVYEAAALDRRGL